MPHKTILSFAVAFCIAFCTQLGCCSNGWSAETPTTQDQRRTDVPEPVVQAMHSAPITALVTSPQDNLLASGSMDGTVKIWSVQTRALLNTLAVSPSWVRSLAFSPDGKQLAVGAGDHSVYTYDAIRGTLLRRFDEANSAVTAVAFSGDGRLLAAGTSRDSVVYVWRIDSGKPYSRITNPPPRALAFGSDPNELRIADVLRTSRWRLKSSGESEELPPYDKKATVTTELVVTSTGKPSVFDASGRKIAEAEGRELAWAIANDGSAKRPPILATSGVQAIRFSLDDRTLIHSTSTGEVVVWDLENGEMSHFLPEAAAVTAPFANAIAFSRDGKNIKTVQDEYQRLRTWKLSSPSPLAPPVRRNFNHNSALISYLQAGKDIGVMPVQPPSNLRIKGKPITITHSGIISATNEQVIYAGFISPPDTLFITSEDGQTGNRLWTKYLPIKSGRITAITVTSDGSTVAVALPDDNIALIDGTNGHVLKTVKSSIASKITMLALSDGGGLLACGATDGSLQLWNGEGKALTVPAGHRATVTALIFSNDGRTLVSGGADNYINVWDVPRGASIARLSGHSSAVTALAYSHDGTILASGSQDSTMKIWNSMNGNLLATTSTGGYGNWLVMSPEGFFDGTRQSWENVPFRLPSAPTRLYRQEQFFAHFYQPGLLRDVVATRTPILDQLRNQQNKRADLNVASYVNSKPAEVQIEALHSSVSVTTRTVQIKVTATDSGSGLRDLRIFRNQSLVRFFHGDLKVAPVTRRYEITVPVEITEGTNEISAYAFNRDDIKSEDAVINIVGNSALKRLGKAYIVAVGINIYSNQEFNLSYAVPDAELITKQLKESLMQTQAYSDVVSVSLLNYEATKSNIVYALQLLAGEPSSFDPPIAKKLTGLERTKPEDVVIIYFAGHGGTSGDRYYLLTHDIGDQKARQEITQEAWRKMLTSALSDSDLNDSLERIQAAQMMLVIDACYSGSVLDSYESRRGPLNSRSIAQLAYEKGAYVLAASQSNQAALELQRLGHGLLTYSIINKGLITFGSDTDNDGRITAREWLRYASQQVPKEIASLTQERSALGRLVEVGGVPVTTQRPRFYFRRDRADDWTISSGRSLR